MKFKHRIWMLPIMTAGIVIVGLSVSFHLTSRTSAALVRVKEVQYPTVEALRTVRAHVTNVEESLQRAVTEGDPQGLNTAEHEAAEVHAALDRLRSAQREESRAKELKSVFDSYFSAASAATKIMLGADGDMSAAVAEMQKRSAALQELLDESQGAAIDEFHTLLTSGTSNIQRSMTASVIMVLAMMIALGVGSWVLISNIFRILGGEPEDAVRTVRAIADGDFTTAIELRTGDDSSVLHGIETLRRKLGTLIRDVRSASINVDSAAAEINTNIDRLSLRTSDQAASLEETAASMEEMTESVKGNADNARHATKLASEARDRAELGGQVAARAAEAMTEINASSRRIADIIGVIDEIAFQTNLLALNAAVEAARAGEQGRGFAVVAAEVRNLAQRCGTAAREIKELIQDSVSKVDDGVKLVDESGRHLNDIVAAAKKVAQIIGEISEASSQQASGLEQVNAAVMQIDQLTQQNAAMAEETSSVAVSMKQQANALTNLIALFRVEGNSYVAPASTASVVEMKPKTDVAKPARAASVRASRKVANSDMEWQEF